MATCWNGNGCDAKKGYWIDKLGNKMKLKYMSSDYLENVIIYIRLYGGVLRDFENNKIIEIEEELRDRECREKRTG
jgi:hypothetical protein